ncbi:MAG: lipopolysaccharide transport periplasmic protein LptA [Mariprofundaceae bacterium]|nr:lipopolysaccharide transport periplasmic protein LptA [Mariprofundaceae bacterium]
MKMKMLLLVCCALMCLPSWLVAAPMVVDADHFELVQDKQRAVFTGHVVATQGELIIKADKMTLWYVKNASTGKSKLNKAKAVGHVWIKTAENIGSADIATFAADSKILVLKGNARMQSEDGEVLGQHIEYNMQSKDSTVLKGLSEEQVRFTFDE